MEAIREGAVLRVRPMAMTVVVILAVFAAYKHSAELSPMCAIAQKRKSFPSKSYCVVENKGFYERCDLAEFNPFDKTHRPPCRRRAAHFVLVLA